ncbi:hypothetical protein LTR62_000569 [Meristemomyces frigidus]|uniref:Uncharacterized protein n=1 Tax=Meristemomyces frigidus TaxID=1508187 RepID=A0AAN7TAA3_9PEZI|nr:hypothetical protein LTR62_000569 [Meristemomyces frigidus]
MTRSRRNTWIPLQDAATPQQQQDPDSAGAREIATTTGERRNAWPPQQDAPTPEQQQNPGNTVPAPPCSPPPSPPARWAFEYHLDFPVNGRRWYRVRGNHGTWRASLTRRFSI